MPLTLQELQIALQFWQGCTLAKVATPVLGEGPANASIVFIGEAPGKKEDELGRPFVGAAGKLLNKLLESIQIERSDVYISNTGKYRPPDNRDPTKKEKDQCMPWLQLELSIIQPKIIIPLGRHSLGHFLTGVTIGEAHGKAYRLNSNCILMPMYHPAAAMYNGSLRNALFQDFSTLKRLLAVL
jgi:uracil-DNA glycosylase